MLKILMVTALLSGTGIIFGNNEKSFDNNNHKKLRMVSTSMGNEIAVSPPPFSKGIFPCSNCHSDMNVNWKRRKLAEEHQDINFTHDSENRWCLDCHNAKNRDKLHLASGKLVSFKESYKLCGQCHGLKLRDWKKGVHGKRTGYWNGDKKYLLCVHCHDPHSPRFKPVTPMPPPVRQENLR